MERFDTLSLADTPMAMDVDRSFSVAGSSASKDTDGDVIMDESISQSPSLPARYHNYFHRIQRVNQGKAARQLGSLADMKTRLDEIDTALADVERAAAPPRNPARVAATLGEQDSVQEAADTTGRAPDTADKSHDQEDKKNAANLSLVKSVFSPTMLGARVAYNSSPQSSPRMSRHSADSPVALDAGSVANNSMESLAPTVPLDGFPQGVQLQLHHHHYYYPPNVPLSGDEGAQAADALTATTSPQIGDREVLLPSPATFHDVPYYISTYAQVATNALIYAYGFYIVYYLVDGVKKDVDLKLQDKIHSLMIEADKCRENFELNRCFKDSIVPAIQAQCLQWEKCMYKDPFSTSGKPVITAQLIGMIINSLLEPITFRSCAVLSVVACTVFALNFVFGFVRAKIYLHGNDQQLQLQRHN